MIRLLPLAGCAVAVALATWGPGRAQNASGFDTVQPAFARHGMVASQEQRATAIGVEVLRQGGNAVDAAVAVGFALAVTHPTAGNIGGGGFMLIRPADGRTTFIDFRERAPGAAS